MEFEESEEQDIKFYTTEDVFYNPHMELSRTLSSLLVGALEENLRVVDGMAASGIRGMRYKKENGNVENVAFVDVYTKAVECIKKGIAANKIKAHIFKSDINRFLFNSTNEYNFIELDPFGTPTPHAYFAVRALRNLKTGYISITATDTAVLCGAHKKACLKNYHSKPLRNYFCHETGLRILINHIARIAHEFNLGIVPLFSFYYRHQMKTIMKLEKGGKKADENLNHVGCINFCPSCLNTTYGKTMAYKHPQNPPSTALSPPQPTSYNPPPHSSPYPKTTPPPILIKTFHYHSHSSHFHPLPILYNPSLLQIASFPPLPTPLQYTSHQSQPLPFLS
ncbi:MAG: methyltransferase [Candidatus Micrarchaeia archaeon]